LAAPLIAGNDLRAMSPEIRSVLTNRELIAVNQDPLGKQAIRVFKTSSGEIWKKPMDDGSTVIGIYNRDAKPATMNFTWQQAGLERTPKRVRDLWKASDEPARGGKPMSLAIAGHGTVVLRVWN
jgi:alpha-galactosidase